jgi:hypothetical protein
MPDHRTSFMHRLTTIIDKERHAVDAAGFVSSDGVDKADLGADSPQHPGQLIVTMDKLTLSQYEYASFPTKLRAQVLSNPPQLFRPAQEPLVLSHVKLHHLCHYAFEASRRKYLQMILPACVPLASLSNSEPQHCGYN